MKKQLILIILLVIVFNLSANEINEDELFNSQDMITTISPVTKNLTNLYPLQKTLNLTGLLNVRSLYAMQRNWLTGQNGKIDDNLLTELIDGDIFFDLRFTNGAKAFIDLGVLYSPSLASGNTSIGVQLKECFIDVPLSEQLGLRVGKQFIQWGRANFWNPTDLINSTGRNILDLSAIREGVSGVRLSLAQGNMRNMYAFFSTNQASNLSNCALALKYEESLATLEYAISAWTQTDQASVVGVDFSTSLFQLDVKAEAALSYAMARNIVGQTTTGSWTIQTKEREWTPKLALNLAKSFSWERPQRINIGYELFYNQTGYAQNVLENSSNKTLLDHNNIYTANQLSRWYQAMFLTINEFPHRLETFSLNTIINGVDCSSIISASIVHSVTDGLSLGCSLSGFLGSPTTEYGSYAQALLLELKGQLVF